jgi:uncharacterized protein
MKLHTNKSISFFSKSKLAGILKKLMAIVMFAIVVPVFAGNKEGQEAFKNGDFETVLKVAKQLVEKGDPQGPWSLGWLYENGKAVPQDYHLAASWYTKAAEQGLRDAQSKLGWLYEKGLGVPQDYNAAASWYTQAAKQGFPEAQSYLGMLYWDGRGVPQDYKLAEKWLFKAAIRGDAKAQNNLGVMYDNGIGHRVDHSGAEKWFTKAAEQGYAPAQFNLGAKYAAGANYKLAASWYAKAAEQGYADAQTNLGLMYENGQGVPKSFSLSYALYDLSGRAELRDALMKKMGSKYISKAQDLSRELAKPEKLKNALEAERQRLETEGEHEQFMAEIDSEVELEMLAMKAMLNKWIGVSEGELIVHPFWGVPQQKYETGGVEYIVYDITSVETISGTPSTTTTNTNTQTYYNDQWEGVKSNVNVTTTEGRPTEYRTRFCKVIFETREGKLEKWVYQGLDCVHQLLDNRERGYSNMLGPDGNVLCRKWHKSKTSFLPVCTEIP